MKMGEIPPTLAAKYFQARMSGAEVPAPEFIRQFMEFITPLEQAGVLSGDQVVVHISGVKVGSFKTEKPAIEFRATEITYTHRSGPPVQPHTRERRTKIIEFIGAEFKVAAEAWSALKMNRQIFYNDVRYLLKEGKIERSNSAYGQMMIRAKQ